MREIELKAVVPDVVVLREKLIAASAVRTFEGSLVDKRYDSGDGTLVASDLVLRLRTYHGRDSAPRSMLDFKGPTEFVDGYKVREEISTTIGDAVALSAMLTALGYVIVREIDREIEMFELDGATLRIEHYPRLDTLVEVEGQPDSIERAIVHTGIARREFTSERLLSFVTRFEARNGVRAALSHRELNEVHVEERRR